MLGEQPLQSSIQSDLNFMNFTINRYFKLISVNNQMKLKLNHPSDRKVKDTYILSNAKSLSKQYQSTKEMKMVRNTIDHQLITSYQKLNSEYSSQTNNNKERAKKEIVGLISLNRRKNMSSNSQYHKISLVEQAQVQPLISNKDVIQYIQLIYQTYNIKDPLFPTNSYTQITQSTIEKDRTKIELCFQQQINSARTTKEFVSNPIQVSQFDDGQSTARNTIKRNNKIVITLRSKTINKKQQKKDNPLMNKSSLNKTKKYIKQVQNQDNPMYRYCFACEQAIFQQNILSHESKCSKLKLAFTFSFIKILSILDQKIQRLKAEINKQILQINSQDIKHKYDQLKSSISKWISLIPNKQQSQKQQRHQWEKYYATVNKQINLNENLELVNRLNWFARLRQNIFSHCNIAQQKQ